MNYRIAIVEDMPRARQALKSELAIFHNIEIVFVAENGKDYLQQLKDIPLAVHPQVVLMDVDMPIVNGIEAIRKSSILYPDIQYIMLTVVDDDDKLFEAIRAGADGYLLKEETMQTIYDSIKEVTEKQGAPMSPRIARKTLKLLSGETVADDTVQVQPSSLSVRETEILKYMVDGLDYKQTGEKLFISPNTVRNHIYKIYEKLHISSKAQAVKLAMKNRWV